MVAEPWLEEVAWVVGAEQHLALMSLRHRVTFEAVFVPTLFLTSRGFEQETRNFLVILY